MANNKRKQGDGTLRQRVDGRWEGRIVVGYDDKGDPKTKSVTAKTKFECEEKLKALLKLLFISLYENNVHADGIEENTAINDYCLVIEHFIHHHYTENITLATVAEALHLSTKQTSRIIRKRYHASLSELLNEKRLNVAAHLLKTSDIPIAQVASRIFYRSENYFFRLFKGKYGLSPLAYRKKHREHIDI